MKKTILDLFCILAILTIMLWAAVTWGGEPQVEVTVTDSGLTILDASKSTGKLTWSIRGEHSILFGGTVAVCRFANYTGALVSVGADGTVTILLLPIGDDTPLPPADNTLADNVRELFNDFPASERQDIAKVHTDTSARLRTIGDGNPAVVGDTVQAIVGARKAAIEKALGERLAAWLPSLQSLSKLVAAEKIAPNDPKGWADAYDAVAEGLR